MAKHVLLEDLNPQQQQAVSHKSGPMLVLAGAGSGKTRVITRRFAYLTSVHKVSPSSILAMTFTNKAANEMKERIEALTGKSAKGLWIGTFHSLSSRILRKEIDKLGYGRDFCIYDDGDTCSLIRTILKEYKMHEALYKGIASRISSLKAALVTSEALLANEDSFGFDEKLAKVYVRYQDDLKKNNALDFDDLIMCAVKLFEKHPEVLKKYQEEFEHMMIDEFQDTNISQYRFARLLASKHKNICVVGDDDQSIYKFRGAEVGNILDFEKDFLKAKVIRLEQNYRSTQNILDAAGSLIAQNDLRKAKKLWTDRGKGEKISYCIANNEQEEAGYIAQTVKELYLKGSYTYSDITVLYRLNQQARVLEDAMRSNGIPHQVVGSISFYKRKEVKDIISYLKVINNPHDSISLKRIINSPPRGIGKTTLTRLNNEAIKKEKSLYGIMKHVSKGNGYSSAFKDKVKGFISVIDGLIDNKEMELSKLIFLVFEKTDYLEFAGEDKAKNLMDIVGSAEGSSLEEFLDSASLFSAQDEARNKDSVSLMTIHTVKGLESPVVFIAGVEDGLMPHFYSIKKDDEIQEERRLFYVGMTRARDMLFLSGAKRRRLYASLQDQQPSRFLSEIPADCCCYIEKRPRTGALSKSHSIPVKPRSISPFVSGVRVRHPKFGEGVVRDCYGETNDFKVMVNFPSVGIKRLSLKFANLERV
ncbi:MAG: UvrD-helicase domain-containing protein [Thermodesulfovibrionia bacterium]|nr:UvrD-helicase domain-containing protein [Thermodesulfovibrionia bacterium]